MQGLKGVSSVAYTSGDPVALAKALSTWVKDNAEFTFKLGIIDGKVIDVREIAELATMPGKEELFSKLLFLIQSPAQRLATVINATGRDLAIVINQGVEKGKFAGLRMFRQHPQQRLQSQRLLKQRLPRQSPQRQRPIRSPRRTRLSRRQASSHPEQSSRRTPPHRRVGKRRPRTRSKDKRDHKFRLVFKGALVWAQRKPERA